MKDRTTTFADANTICAILKNNGFKAFFVGGCVRDSLMNVDMKDVDITTDARPADVQRMFPDHIDTGLKHGTVSVRVTPHGELFEVTTFRVDGAYDDGRHPDDVTFVTDIEDDLARRDFTINAIAFDPCTNEFADPFNGKNDIDAKIVRAVGNAKDRFMEDPLRVLRAMRFAIKLGFVIDDNTAAAMHDAEVLAKLDACISKERITDELRKMLTCNKPVHDIFMTFSDVIFTIIPSLKDSDAPHNNPWHKHDIFEHMLFVTDACDTNKFEIKLAALLHDIGKPATRTTDENGVDHFKNHPRVSTDICRDVVFANDLRLSTKEAEHVLTLIDAHDVHLTPDAKNVRRMIINLGEEITRDLMVLKNADLSDHVAAPGEDDRWNDNISRFTKFRDMIDDTVANMNAFAIRDLAVNGNDIMAIFNIKAGPRIGEVLRTTFDAVINGDVANDRDALLAFVTDVVKE